MSSDSSEPEVEGARQHASSRFVKLKEHLRLLAHRGKRGKKRSPLRNRSTDARSGERSATHRAVLLRAPSLDANNPETSEVAPASRVDGKPSVSWNLLGRKVSGPRNRSSSSAESTFSRVRQSSHTPSITARKRSSAVRLSTTFSDLEDVEADKNNWKNFGKPPADIQSLFLGAMTKHHAEEGFGSDTDYLCGCCARQKRGYGNKYVLPDKGARTYSSETCLTEPCSLSGSSPMNIAKLGRKHASRTETSEEISTPCSGEWPSSLTAEPNSNETTPSRRALLEEQELLERVAGWDPSQEDGYALSLPLTPEQVDPDQVDFELLQNYPQEDAMHPSLPGTSHKAFSSSSRKNSESPSTDWNLYQDLLWLAEGSEDLPSKDRGAERQSRTSDSSLPTDEPSANSHRNLDAIRGTIEDFVSVLAQQRETQAAESLKEVVSTVNGGSPTRPDPSGTPQSKAGSLGPPSSAIDRLGPELQPTISAQHSPSKFLVTEQNDSTEIPKLDDHCSKVSSETEASAKRPQHCNKITVESMKMRKKCCEDTMCETDKNSQGGGSSSSKKEALTRVIKSLRLVDMPDASWDAAPSTSTGRSGLHISEFQNDDVTALDNGEISIRIRTSTRKKSTMVWPFGALSPTQGGSPTRPALPPK